MSAPNPGQTTDKKARKPSFEIETAVPPELAGTDVPSEIPTAAPLPTNREPLVPGVPPQTGKTRHITPELWTLVRACAEGRRFSLQGLSDLTGISFETIKGRAEQHSWQTPDRVRAGNEGRVNAVVNDIFDSMFSYLEEHGDGRKLGTKGSLNSPGDTFADEAGDDSPGELSDHDPDGAMDLSDAKGLDLRNYLATPAKFRPTAQQMIPMDPLTMQDRLAMLDRLRGDLRTELMKSADQHQLAVSEISKMATMHLLKIGQEDPGLLILMSNELEKIDRVARRNLKLDQDKDPLAGARNVSIMSDPTFRPVTVVDVDVDDEPEPEENHGTIDFDEDPNTLEMS